MTPQQKARLAQLRAVNIDVLTVPELKEMAQLMTLEAADNAAKLAAMPQGGTARLYIGEKGTVCSSGFGRRPFSMYLGHLKRIRDEKIIDKMIEFGERYITTPFTRAVPYGADGKPLPAGQTRSYTVTTAVRTE